MNAAKALKELQRTGLTLEVIDGGMIKVQPRTLLTDETRQLIREHKPELVRLLSGGQQAAKRIRAQGFDCGRCGCSTYGQVEIWETIELADGPWTHGHRLMRQWRCEGCGSIFQLIGGSQEPQYIQ